MILSQYTPREICTPDRSLRRRLLYLLSYRGSGIHLEGDQKPNVFTISGRNSIIEKWKKLLYYDPFVMLILSEANLIEYGHYQFQAFL